VTNPNTQQPAGDAAVMPNFADAQGLDALLAAGGRSAETAARSHGDAGKTASPPAVVSDWPPPPTPDPLKTLARQLDTIASTLTTMLTGVNVTPEDPKFVDQVTDGIWPVMFSYGGGSEKPSKGLLWLYAIASIGGLVTVKIAKFQQAKAKAAGVVGEIKPADDA
jgi:hypothetical protein